MAKEKKQEELVKEAVEEAKEQQEQKEQQNEEEVTEAAAAAENIEEELAEEKKEKKPSKEEEIIAELTDKVARQMAEFDNFRKRTDKEKTQMFEIGAKSVIEKLLPVVDNFERGLEAVPEEQKEDSFVKGMDLIYRQIMTMFEEIGVKPIEAVGQQFDPDFHNAVLHIEDEQYEENTIIEEYQKGYMYNDSVVRHSMVRVAN